MLLHHMRSIDFVPKRSITSEGEKKNTKDTLDGMKRAQRHSLSPDAQERRHTINIIYICIYICIYIYVCVHA